METLCASLGLDWDRSLGDRLPPSATTVTRPDAEKWKRHAAEIERVWPIVAAAAERASAWMAAR
jgi:hypothetical protein